jgi:hypothetical protein
VNSVIAMDSKHQPCDINRFDSVATDSVHGVEQTNRQSRPEALFAKSAQQATFVVWFIVNLAEPVSPVLLPPTFRKVGYLLVAELERQMLGDTSKRFF